MFDNTIYRRVNAPKAHQRIIGRLMMRLGNLYYDQKRIPYEPFPETMIDEDQTSPTPDVLLFENLNNLNKIIIEVSGNTGFKRDFEKVKELVQAYGVPEGFVYNYQKKTWHKYVLGQGEEANSPSYSSLLQYDLDELLK